MSIWDVELDKLRSSRLLALRMHVARYVVRTGATQRTAVALVDPTTLVERGDQLRELLEAAGAADPVVADPAGGGPLPEADVVLVGERVLAFQTLREDCTRSPQPRSVSSGRSTSTGSSGHAVSRSSTPSSG